MKPLLSALLVCAAALPAAPPEKKDKEPSRPNTLTPQQIAEGWILLFDGETTFGWKVEGEAKVEDGALVLGGDKATTATPSTTFGGCRLELEGRHLAGPGDAAVSLTSRGVGEGTQAPVKGVAHGAVSSGGAGWQHTSVSSPPGAPVRTTLRIEVPAGTKVALRSVKLKPVGLKSIFNGKDLTGWKEVKTERSKSEFTVTDKGELNIKNGPGDLQTEGQWDDFVLQLEVFSNGDHLNSGVFFRCLPDQFWSGYEAQIRNQWKEDDRTKPVDYGTGGIYNRQPARKVVSSDREWFTMTIAAEGNHLAVWVNGYQTADYTDTRPPDESARKGSKTDKGTLSLQGHDPTTDLSFRNIRIAELPRAQK
jgi:hypothetical protein